MTITDWVIILAVTLVAGVDVYLLMSPYETISTRMKNIAQKVSIGAYAWGSLGGHFFGWVDSFYFHWGLSLGLLLLIGFGLSGFQLAKNNWQQPIWAPAAYFLVGFVLGVYLIPV